MQELEPNAPSANAYETCLKAFSSGLRNNCTCCERGEGVHGVLTLFCCGAAQVVCHALRAVELREQLEVDGDRQEEEVEEKRRSRIKENAP